MHGRGPFIPQKTAEMPLFEAHEVLLRVTQQFELLHRAQIRQRFSLAQIAIPLVSFGGRRKAAAEQCSGGGEDCGGAAGAPRPWQEDQHRIR